MIVFSLCAMVSTVHPLNSVLIVVWIRSSVSRSTAAVASSMTRIFVFRRSARARQTSWRWPTLDSIEVQEGVNRDMQNHMKVVISTWTYGKKVIPFGPGSSGRVVGCSSPVYLVVSQALPKGGGIRTHRGSPARL